MPARDNILARIRARQGKAASASADDVESVRTYLQSRPRHPRPRSDWEVSTRFRERAIGLATTVEEVDSLAAVPAAVMHYLKSRSLPLEAACWPEFSGLEWRAAGVNIATRPARDSDLVGITGAFCAIAETGTLMTVTGPATPATTSLLPETHVAVVPVARIVRGMEEAWQLLRDELGQPPRAVNFISGPSRTADIEQTVTLGAHGPYRVHVVLVR